MRKSITIMLAILAVVVVFKFQKVKKSAETVYSYLCTVASQAEQEVKDQVPTRLEIERVRHEIGNLDADAGGMIRPIAEYMAAITKLKKDMQTSQTNLDKERELLLRMTKDLESNPSHIEYGGKLYPAEQIRAKLQKDFDSFKRVEAHHQIQKKLLEAKEASLQAAHDQLAKVVAKKREYEVRLAQLETNEEMLQASLLGSPLQLDDSRATQIESALADIEKRQSVRRAEAEIRTGVFASDGIPVGKPKETNDVSTIRRYLETPPALVSTSPVGKN